MSGDQVILGLDVGTSSVRALAYNRTGTLVAGSESQIAYAPDAAADGRLTVDGPHLFDLLARVIDQTSNWLVDRRSTVAAVGMSCFWHSLVALDNRDGPLTPVFLWGDTRAESVLPSLIGKVDVDRLHQATGCRLHSSYWPAKLIWLSQREPDLFGTSHRFVSFSEYAFQRWFGSWSVSTSMASATGLLNTKLCSWDEYALSLIPNGVESRLSPISDEPFVGLSPEFAARWPALAEVPWMPAWGDGACSNIGATGLDTRSAFVVTIGTSAAVRAVTAGRTGALPPSLWRYLVDRKRTITGGALSEGGNVIAWLNATLKLPLLDQAEIEIAARSPDAAGLTILPFIAGERSPDWTGGMRATIAGLSLATTPLDVLQAAMESIAYELAVVVDGLVRTLAEPDRILASGAALARSPVWVQIIANVLGRTLGLAPQIESSSRGAALLVLERLGLEKDVVQQESTKGVDPVGSERYAAAIKRQRDFRQKLEARTED